MAQYLNRREFLAASSGAAFAAGLPAGARAAAAGSDAARPAVSNGAWRALLQQLRGALLRPTDALFPDAARPNNLRYEKITPAGIARCLDATDVRAAIGWCRDYNVGFAVRSGGHSYAGFSTTRGLLIDVSPIGWVRYDDRTGLVHIGGGCRNQDIYAALSKVNRTITHGRCPTVGAAGFLLGGGIGFNMRDHGLGCDQVVSTELVTAHGSVETVSAVSNEELFWACRGGGGGNFGVNTAFSLTTFPTLPVTVFRIRWERASEELAFALLAALGAGPSGLGSRVSLQADGKAGVTVDLLGQLKGGARDLADILGPAYRRARPTSERIVAAADYWAGQDFLHEKGAPAYYQERSGYVRGMLAHDTLETGFSWLRKAPAVHGTCDLRFFQTGGAINTVAPEATAFIHRGNDWLMVIGYDWSGADDADPALIRRGHTWQDEFYDDMRRYTDGGCYQNFVDPSLRDWRRAYYGANYPRLERVKQAIDPDRVFNFAQGL